SSGLLPSPDLRPGFRLRTMVLAQKERDSYIVLDAPERLYDIAALPRDSHRFGIESIWSRKYGEIAAVVSTTRLRNIAGRYVGKDDPVAIIRTRKIFPATEEFGPPFALAPFVAGDTRGSHHLPLMPVRANTPASTFFCVPLSL
ncbi:fructose 1,6-bisphosphatase, partial [Thermus scotoductus]